MVARIRIGPRRFSPPLFLQFSFFFSSFHSNMGREKKKAHSSCLIISLMLLHHRIIECWQWQRGGSSKGRRVAPVEDWPGGSGMLERINGSSNTCRLKVDRSVHTTPTSSCLVQLLTWLCTVRCVYFRIKCWWRGRCRKICSPITFAEDIVNQVAASSNSLVSNLQ